jgi:hypothetical protein
MKLRVEFLLLHINSRIAKGTPVSRARAARHIRANKSLFAKTNSLFEQ